MQTPDHRITYVFFCAATVLLGTAMTTSAQLPDNAALLYYQAFLMYETPDGTMSNMRDDFRQGRIPVNDAITEYIEKNERVIDTVIKATNLDTCDWGYDYSLGAELSMPNLAKVRQIAFLLAAEARWQATQGNYQTALDHCIALRKMALHTCDKTLVSYLVGIAIDALANGVTEDILGLALIDADTLNEHRAALAQINGQFPSAAVCLTQEAEVCVMTMTRDKMQTQIQLAREMGVDMASDQITERLKEGDEAFYDRNREFYLAMMGKLAAILEADNSYAETRAAFDEFAEQIHEQTRENPDATLASLALDPTAAKRIYELAIRRQTNVNALLAAMDVYLARAQTGQWPETLPATCPPDLFSGKPFAYAKTAEGFTLRCQVPETPGKEPYAYEFKLAK